MIELIGRGKLRWYGHVKRMKEERTARRYLEMRVDGTEKTQRTTEKKMD